MRVAVRRTVTTFVSVVAAMATTMAVMPAARATTDETVTAVGSVFCDAGNGNLTRFPLTGLRVELMDSDCDGSQICDDVMGVGYVQADGHYSVTGSGGDPFGGKPDVYVRFAYNDDHGVRLTDELDSTRSFSTPEHDHDNVGSGTIDFGGWVTGLGVGAGDGTQCRVWSEAHRAYQGYIAEIGSPPPAGHLDVEYWSGVWTGTPWTNTDTIHWPIHYAANALDHEFGHSIRHAADGNAAHFAQDVTQFRYARTHMRCAPDANVQPGESHSSIEGYGFNEGWAEYWANDVSGCPGTVDDAIEGEIAWALHGVQVNTKVSRKDMVQVLLSNPGSIHSMDDYMNAFSRRVGKSASALLAEAKRLPTSVGAAYRKPYTETERAAQVGTQASGLNAMIAELRRPITQGARIGSRRGGSAGPCQGNECETLFNSIVGPILRGGQASGLQVYQMALTRAATPAWAQQVARAQTTGAFDAWLSDYRSTMNRDVRAASDSSLTRAMEALTAARAQFGPAFDAYAAELTKARKHLDPAAGGGRYGVAVRVGEPFRTQVVLAEDRGQKR